MNECGLIVWDYRTGDVICADTGEVIDHIYDYSIQPRQKYREFEEPVTVPYRALREHKRFLRRYKRALRRYREARKIEEQGFVVDFNKYINEEPYSILTRRTIEALKEVAVNKEIQRIIDVGRQIIEENPYLVQYTQRTMRAKLALQYIVGSRALGLEIDRQKVIDTFRISSTTYTRLIRIADKIQPYIVGRAP